MQNKIKTVSIGISALNEGTNIGFLLREIFEQKLNNIELENVIVVSDGSTDNTVKESKKIRNKKLIVVEEKMRMGKNVRSNQIFSMCKSDALVILDADVLITDDLFIQKLIEPILAGKADLTSSRLHELKPKGGFERVLFVSMKLKEVLFDGFKSGHNVYNCHGPAKAYSKNLYNVLTFNIAGKEGDDMFSYLFTIKNGFKFYFVNNAQINYRLPSSPMDHFKQSTRYYDSIQECKKIFGEKFVETEFRIPFYAFFISTIKAMPILIINSIYVAIYLLTLLGVKIGRLLNFSLKDTWNVRSSKILK